jgi:NADH-quinone oxidoreductase subunit A
MELSQYLPILVLGALAFIFALASLVVSHWIRPSKPNPAKLAPYESGIEPERLPSGERFSQLGLFGLVEMVVFIALVFVAYVYIWRNGGLDWEREERTRFRLAELQRASDVEREELAHAR